jgi:hypothetical protein
MGVLLIFLGLTPGLLEKCAEVILKFGRVNPLLVRLIPPIRTRTSIPQPRWLVAAGVIVILLSLLAYVLR